MMVLSHDNLESLFYKLLSALVPIRILVRNFLPYPWFALDDWLPLQLCKSRQGSKGLNIETRWTCLPKYLIPSIDPLEDFS